jgi:hypothetical protein
VPLDSLPTTREGMTEETVAAYNARSLDTDWSADWFLEGNMAIAKIEPPPQFDLGTKVTQWRQRHAEGKAIRRAIPRESHAGWTPGKDRPDPMKLMAQSNQGRQEHLVPLRMGAHGCFALRVPAGLSARNGCRSVHIADQRNSPGDVW